MTHALGFHTVKNPAEQEPRIFSRLSGERRQARSEGGAQDKRDGRRRQKIYIFFLNIFPRLPSSRVSLCARFVLLLTKKREKLAPLLQANVDVSH